MFNAPKRMPEKGFYYHYKHDPAGPVHQYAYEMIGVGHFTEDYLKPEDENMVVYLPIYEATVYKNGKMFDLRPLEMWMGDIEKDGKTMKRFTKITDEAVIKQLKEIKKQMYSLTE